MALIEMPKKDSASKRTNNQKIGLNIVGALYDKDGMMLVSRHDKTGGRSEAF